MTVVLRGQRVFGRSIGWRQPFAGGMVPQLGDERQMAAAAPPAGENPADAAGCRGDDRENDLAEPDARARWPMHGRRAESGDPQRPNSPPAGRLHVGRMPARRAGIG